MKRILILLLMLIPLSAEAQNGGASRYVSATPTIDTGGAYASGDLMGGKLTFTNALRSGVGTGYLAGVNVSDLAAQAVDLDIVIFSANPSATTFTDQAAFDIADADIGKVVAVINLGSSSRFAFNDNSVHMIGSLFFPLRAGSSAGPAGTLYGAVVARGAYTAATAADIVVTLGIAQD